MESSAKIFVAGHRGLVGSAIRKRLQADGYENLVLRSRADLDLTDQDAVRAFFKTELPEYVFLAAAKVGGIYANSMYPADFLHDNLAIELNVIDSACRFGAKKLLFLGSSCIYPRLAPQPMREEYLLGGSLEPTNEWYAIAKIAGLKTCEAYRRQHGFNAISLMPSNLYGPGDNFSLQNSHVLPALIRKFHEAKIAQAEFVEIWGTGSPRREFLHVDDLADACVFLMNEYDDYGLINVGSGVDITIGDLAKMIAGIVGFKGTLKFNSSYPDGTPRKLLDVTRMTAKNWTPRISLEQGIASTYEWYLGHIDDFRR